jgi:hypothetical protein
MRIEKASPTGITDGADETPDMASPVGDGPPPIEVCREASPALTRQILAISGQSVGAAALGHERSEVAPAVLSQRHRLAVDQRPLS